MKIFTRLGLAIGLAVILAACGGGGGGGDSGPPHTGVGCVWDTSNWDACDWSS
jgi:hypothetical protein